MAQVLGHGDLLCGNIILRDRPSVVVIPDVGPTNLAWDARFIDYEYVFHRILVDKTGKPPGKTRQAMLNIRVTDMPHSARGRLSWPTTFPNGPGSSATIHNYHPDWNAVGSS